MFVAIQHETPLGERGVSGTRCQTSREGISSLCPRQTPRQTSKLCEKRVFETYVKSIRRKSLFFVERIFASPCQHPRHV